MTTTSEYLNEFTPDWPLGHVLVLDDGTAKPFVVKVTNVPGDFPIWGYTVDGNDEPWRFRANGDNGYYAADRHRHRGAHLRNVAPPKREPREVWVNYYPNRGRSVILDSRELADELATPRRIECVHFREVIEETKAKPEEGKRLPENFDLDAAREALRRWIEIAERGASK